MTTTTVNGSAAALLVLTTLALWLGSPSSVQAQTRREYQQWTAAAGTARPLENAPKVRLWLDLHARRGAGQTVGIVRPGVGYDVASWLTLWLGYAWVPVFRDAGNDLREQRLWQQATLHHRVAGWSLQSRTRFEQRFSDGGDDVGFRVREFVRVNWQPSETSAVGLAFWDEIFLGIGETDWGTVGGYDQNRVFLGPFLPIPRVGRFEFGYLLAHLRRPGGNVMQHVLAATLFVSL
ncbi:MAG: DUF2490 domain-containing protein [Myxococcota bacterium]